MKKLKGFTLIELIVVIAIIGILAGVLAPNMMNYIARSRIKTQNSNARVIFNASQTIVQEYKFKERKMTSGQDIGDGDFYFYWDGHSGKVVDSSGAGVVASATFVEDFANSINKIFSGSEETVYKVYVNNYIVKSVVSGRTDTDMYMGSYPVKQEERVTGRSVVAFDMSTID